MSKIAKLSDHLVPLCLNELFGYASFTEGLRAHLPDDVYRAILHEREYVNSIEAFQKRIILKILKYIEITSISTLTSSGFDTLSPQKRYLYISNHRDIVLDSAYLNTTLFEHGYETSQIAVGDNLMRHRISELIFLLNKSFVVKRSGTPMELYRSSVELSQYICEQVTQGKDSVWIAQREGRAKDGNDLTQSGFVKMLSLSVQGDLTAHFKALHIVPVAISYEYNPCDLLMAQSFLHKRANPGYSKSREEDTEHIMLGLRGHKGRVHFQFCKPLDSELDALDAQQGAKKQLEQLANLIDESIHTGYRLHAVNAVAHDLLHGSHLAEQQYTPAEIDVNTAYLEEKAQKLKGDTDGAGRAYLLGMYAKPLENQMRFAQNTTSGSIRNRLRNLLLAGLTLLGTCSAFAQKVVPFFGKIEWISGYGREISGENLAYFSAYPDYASVSLLTRCTDGKKVIEWETAPVPGSFKGKYLYFSWVAAHSSGTSSGERHFDLYVDDEKLLTFSTLPAHQRPLWTFAAPDSTRLVFQQIKRDGANDAHGLAFLRLPAARLKPGRPVRLKVIGQAQNSNDWYMTFKFSFEEKVEVEAMPFLLKNGRQPLLLTMLHFGAPQMLEVKAGQTPIQRFVAQEGINTFDVPLPAAGQPDSVFVEVRVGRRVLVSRYVGRSPVVHRELHFIHHSHTDVGYSHLQPEVERIHNRNIDDALKMIQSTRNLPEPARFKWNVESLWAVENYLRQANPAQKAAFLEAVRAGDICLSAFYANILTGISEPEEIFHYTDYAGTLRAMYGIPLKSAMISDVPGAAWTTVTAFAQTGVRYFSSGPNFLGDKHPYHGDRVGHFVKTWGDRPVWWTSPSGEEKVLFWAAAKGYSSWHGMAAGAVFERAPRKIAAYLRELQAQNYPYDLVQWRYNIVSDNGPIDTSICRFVDQWNRKYASPTIVLNTTDRLFEAFEKKYGDHLPTVKGDITPYWEDGALSTAQEEGENRANSLRLQQLATLYAMLQPERYDAGDFYEAWRSILLFHEHTWGAHNSISSPDLPFVTEQWRIKRAYFSEGSQRIQALEQRLFEPFREDRSDKIAVFNTLSWPQTGLVVLSSTFPATLVKDTSGRIFPVQKLSDGRLAFIARDVPPLGAMVYTLVESRMPPAVSPFVFSENSVSNGKIHVTWDARQGSILRLRTNGVFNFAGKFRDQGLNSYWYVPGLDPDDAQTNSNVTVSVVEKGPVLARVMLRAEAPGAVSFERTLTLLADSDLLHIENTVDKKSVRQKEALHFGFPFDSTLRHSTLDAGYGTLRYPDGQLPGSNLDYLYGRRWLDVSSQDKGVQCLWIETPLAEPGAMIDERRTIDDTHKVWKTTSHPVATWFSYAMNNYWHTNYKADQSGIARFRYALRPHGMYDAVEVEKKADEFTQPLVALPLRADARPGSGLFQLSNPRVMVTSVTPQGKDTFLVRLFNPDPSAQTTAFRPGVWQPVTLTDQRTGKAVAADSEIQVAGMGIVTLLVKL